MIERAAGTAGLVETAVGGLATKFSAQYADPSLQRAGRVGSEPGIKRGDGALALQMADRHVAGFEGTPRKLACLRGGLGR